MTACSAQKKETTFKQHPSQYRVVVNSPLNLFIIAFTQHRFKTKHVDHSHTVDGSLTMLVASDMPKGFGAGHSIASQSLHAPRPAQCGAHL